MDVTYFTNLVECQPDVGVSYRSEGIRFENNRVIRIDLRMKGRIACGLDVRCIVPRARGVGGIRVVVCGN